MFISKKCDTNRANITNINEKAQHTKNTKNIFQIKNTNQQQKLNEIGGAKKNGAIMTNRTSLVDLIVVQSATPPYLVNKSSNNNTNNNNNNHKKPSNAVAVNKHAIAQQTNLNNVNSPQK